MHVSDSASYNERCLIVTLSTDKKIPVARRLLARIDRPDGTTIYTYAVGNSSEYENESLTDTQCVLLSMNAADVPIGSEIALEIAVV